MDYLNQLKNKNLWQTASLINHQWQHSDTGRAFAVHNPATGQLLAQVADLSDTQVEQAIGFARLAQADWKKTTAKQRGEILQQWADLIDQNIDDLAYILTLEQGKPLAEARGEISYANSFIRWFAEEGKRTYGDIIPTTNQKLRYSVLKEPIGVCAAITPWNFPAAMITRKVAPALAAGCTMLVKPASETPLTALALGALAIQAGIPKGVLQIITGEPQRLGKILCQHHDIRKLSFTGSTAVGKLLMAQCADSLKKLSLELGGNAPFIVFDDADLEQAAQGLIVSKYRNAGQTCVCANRIYVQRNIADRFIEILQQKTEQLITGNGLESDTQIGPLINQKAFDKATRLLDDAIKKGATLVTGGTPHPDIALAMTPAILRDITEQMDIAHEEIFAPITPIVIFDDEDEVIRLANNTPYGLAAYFYTNNLARSWRVCEQLEYGMVAQNTGLLSNEVAPFGGIKQSGFGREGSKYGIEEYLVTKYWCVDVS